MELISTYARSKQTLINLANVDRIVLKDRKIYFQKFTSDGIQLMDKWEYPTNDEAQDDYDMLSQNLAVIVSSLTPTPPSSFSVPDSIL